MTSILDGNKEPQRPDGLRFLAIDTKAAKEALVEECAQKSPPLLVVVSKARGKDSFFKPGGFVFPEIHRIVCISEKLAFGLQYDAPLETQFALFRANILNRTSSPKRSLHGSRAEFCCYFPMLRRFFDVLMYETENFEFYELFPVPKELFVNSESISQAEKTELAQLQTVEEIAQKVPELLSSGFLKRRGGGRAASVRQVSALQGQNSLIAHEPIVTFVPYVWTGRRKKELPMGFVPERMVYFGAQIKNGDLRFSSHAESEIKLEWRRCAESTLVHSLLTPDLKSRDCDEFCRILLGVGTRENALGHFEISISGEFSPNLRQLLWAASFVELVSNRWHSLREVRQLSMLEAWHCDFPSKSAHSSEFSLRGSAPLALSPITTQLSQILSCQTFLCEGVPLKYTAGECSALALAEFVNENIEREVANPFQWLGYLPESLHSEVSSSPGGDEQLENGLPAAKKVCVVCAIMLNLEPKCEYFLLLKEFVPGKILEVQLWSELVQYLSPAVRQKVLESRCSSMLLQQAIEHGKAESASIFLHDLGNQLTSVAGWTNEVRRDLQQLILALAKPDGLYAFIKLLRTRDAAVSDMLRSPDAAAHMAEFLAALLPHVEKLDKSVKSSIDILHINRKYFGEERCEGSTAFKPFGVLEALRDACELCPNRKYMKEGFISLNHTIAKDLVAKLDRSQFMRTLLNLLTNACEAAEEAQRSPRIEVNGSIIGTNLLQVTITDNGVGWSGEKAQKLGELGYTSKAKGTGLGVYSSRKYLESVGGSLQLFSEGEMCGACVTLILPL